MSLMIFTDGSVDPKTKTGFGAMLAIDQLNVPLSDIKRLVQTKQFENTSSSRLELQTLLWALTHFCRKSGSDQTIHVYTDSQSITGLRARKKYLIENDFRSSKKVPLKNADLYRQFYAVTDELDIKLVKIKGHQKSDQKDELDRIFSIVDKAARRALRISMRPV